MRRCNKNVFSSTPKAKDINKKIGQIKADLERHFDLVQAQDKITFPQAVIGAYHTPINGHDLHQQKTENLQFGNELDKVIECYVDLCKQVKKGKEAGTNSPEKIEFFELQKKEIKERVKSLSKQGHQVFDDKHRIKTLVLAIDEYLLHFIQLVIVGERSENTLEKWIGRKTY